MITRDRIAPSHRQISPPAVFGLMAIILVCASRAVLNDGDTFTHIAAGRWMIEHGEILTSDPFSATFAGQPWQAHEWLSEVLFGLAFASAGLTGVVLLTAGAVATTFGSLARHVGRWCGWRATMLLVAAALVCVMPSILARPHVLAMPLLELWAAGLLIARSQGRAPDWWLLPLMAAWANLHGSFAFGLALTLAFAIEASWIRFDRRWWVFVAGALAAALLTPRGWDGLLFPLRLLQFRSLSFIKEWQPLDLGSAFGFDMALLGLMVLVGTGWVRVPALRSVLLVGLLYLALAHSRHVVLFGIVGALLLAEPVGRAFAERPARGGWLGWAGVVLVAMLRIGFPVADTDGPAAPMSAMAQLPPLIAQGRVLNSNQFGGYLALAGLHPFIDGRVELFGDAFVDGYLAMSQADGALRQGVERYGIEWALLAVDDPLVAGFDRLAGWRRQFADGVAVVFVRG